MAWGKIYETTWWGVGVDNTIGWGSIYKDIALPSAATGLLQILEARSTYFENEDASRTLLTNLENIDL